MDILEKAYDYIDYTLAELSRLQGNCVSLLYFFKVFSPAGEVAQKILLDHEFIKIQTEKNLSVVCITDKGREVVMMGGVREYLGYLDEQATTKRQRIKTIRRMLGYAACVAGAVIFTRYALRRA
ncbi:MAG TPA: hypothetical protein VFZ47_10125 [Chitinophagaceae bacterium]